MNRRQLITGAAAMTTLLTTQAQAAADTPRTFLELATFRLHNSDEAQLKRVSDYLETGRFPALTRAGALSGNIAKPFAALSNLIGPDGPAITTITQYASLAAMQQALTALEADEGHQKALQTLSAGPGLPFVTVESSLVQSLAVIPVPVIPTDVTTRPPRIFELRTYQSQSWPARQKKAAMFSSGEIGIFERLGMGPVFIGESVIGPRQPNITYMLSFDSLAEREKHWQTFGSDPEWKKLSAPPELKDAQIVANISNTILRPLPFSPLR
ncbi:NIPSNAP family protein [Edaphobacter aggregans]|uniref:NIPSNAP family protein n=1 Tax=Edaphobacter aggregans TaxID=570835 RepID=UPI00054F4C7D|nr:NIPSNAP family protein [Edaphobacter aggregans]